MHYPGNGQPQLYRAQLAQPGSNAVAANGASGKFRFVPDIPTPQTQYYCKELDGSYTLRSTNEIMNSCQPGHWMKAAATGLPYFIRTGK